MNVMTIVWIVAIGALFLYFWRAGQLAQLANFVRETREELNKCTWPTWGELKGSTVVVMISIVLIGGFTVIADAFFGLVMRLITPG
jgi:preprotein translocase subunit SecE